MNFLRGIQNFFRKLKAWHNDRKTRRARRAVAAAADTAAAGAGFALRLGVKAVVTVLLVFITTGMLLACIFAVYVKTCMTGLELTPEELSSALSSTVWVQNDAGQMEELEVLHATINRIWVDFEQIPEDVQHAAVAIEDRNFYTHKGVDWWRTLGAFGNMFLSMQDTFGGSTLTQQLIKNLTGKDEVTVQRKLLEIFQALEFEKKYTKDEILTMYLNQIYLGEGCYGVGTAAREYFGKEVWELDLAESAALIGITNNPSLYDPYIGPISTGRNKTRQELILYEMYDQGYITHEQYVEAKNEELHFRRAEGEGYQIPIHSYYVDSLIYELTADLAEERGITKGLAEQLINNGGYNIYACMDPRIQRIVDEQYQNVSNLPQSYYNPSGQQLSSAIVIMDPYSGEIKALAGQTGVKTGSFTENYATELCRQPGSSFKPVAVYAPALDLGLITQRTQVNDSPNIKLHGTSWYPKNSGGGYRGWVSIKGGVTSSLNTVAAQVLDRIGLQASWSYLTERFGFHSLVRDVVDSASGQVVSDYVYPALALGQLSYGVTVEEMTQAYTAFVNDGVMSFGRTYSLVTDGDGKVILDNPARQQVAIKANTAWNMADMLQNAATYGTGSMANFGTTAVAGKTGTTSNDFDRYFAGFTRYYVAAVWTGYRYPTEMYFYSNPAGLIWHDVMKRVHEGLEWWSFNTPTIDPGHNTLWEGDQPTVTVDPNATEAPTPPPMDEEPTPPPPTEAPPVDTGGQLPPVDTGGQLPPVGPTPTVAPPTDTPYEAPPTPTVAPPTDTPYEAPPTPTVAPPTDTPYVPPTEAPTPPPPTDTPYVEPTADPNAMPPGE